MNVLSSMYDELRNSVTKDEFSELKKTVHELAQAQKRTEIRVEELAEAQKRTEIRVEELVKRRSVPKRGSKNWLKRRNAPKNPSFSYQNDWIIPINSLAA